MDDGPQTIEAIAQHLSKATPAETNPLHLAVDVVPSHDPVTLRCTLTNVSPQPVRLQQYRVPCANWSTLHVRGLTTDGRFLPERPGVGSVITGSPPEEITLAPGEIVVHELALNDVYGLAENPRNTDVLLLWSYGYNSRISTGIALLPRHRS